MILPAFLWTNVLKKLLMSIHTDSLILTFTEKKHLNEDHYY